MNNFSEQARRLYKLIQSASENELVERADDILQFLYRITDAMKKSSSFVIHIQSLKEIIYGLESNPDFTLHQKETRVKLNVFFENILKEK